MSDLRNGINRLVGNTKRNKAGNQQPYVPAGNGDESGEYADMVSGSNRHYTNPGSISTTQTQPGIESVIFNQKQEETNSRESLTNNLTSKFIGNKEEIDGTVAKVVETTSEEGQKIISDYLKENEKLTIKFGGAGRNAAGCAWGYTQINTNTDPHTIRHELGHTFDNFYGKQLEVDPSKPTGYVDKDYASMKYVDDETGLTMNEALHEELGVSMYRATFGARGLRYIKEKRDNTELKKIQATRINEVYNKYADKVFDELTGISNSREKYILYSKQYKEAVEVAKNEMINTEIGQLTEQARQEVNKAEEEYRSEMIRKGAWMITYANSPKVVEARAKLQALRPKYEEVYKKLIEEKFGDKWEEYNKIANNRYTVYQKLKGVAGLVGDTHDYLKVSGNNDFYTTNGHGDYYFNQRKESGYALEIFANMFDCFTSKDEWKKECVKEMFPMASKIFEKIYYKKGRK